MDRRHVFVVCGVVDVAGLHPLFKAKGETAAKKERQPDVGIRWMELSASPTTAFHAGKC